MCYGKLAIPDEHLGVDNIMRSCTYDGDCITRLLVNSNDLILRLFLIGEVFEIERVKVPPGIAESIYLLREDKDES